jgi:hypothetical protein
MRSSGDLVWELGRVAGTVCRGFAEAAQSVTHQHCLPCGKRWHTAVGDSGYERGSVRDGWWIKLNPYDQQSRFKRLDSPKHPEARASPGLLIAGCHCLPQGKQCTAACARQKLLTRQWHTVVGFPAHEEGGIADVRGASCASDRFGWSCLDRTAGFALEALVVLSRISRLQCSRNSRCARRMAERRHAARIRRDAR